MTKFDAELKGFEKLEGFEFEDGGFETAQNLAKVARKVLHKRYLGKLFAVAADGSELEGIRTRSRLVFGFECEGR